jgi:hypothetical protein
MHLGTKESVFSRPIFDWITSIHSGATRSKDFFNRPIFNDKEATKINELNNNSEQQPARSGVFGHNFVFLSKRIHVL